MATNKLLSSTKLIGVFFIMLVCALPANAQFLRTSYFMEGTHYRQQLNPALTPTKGYFNLPVIGAVNATVGSTSLGYQDIIDIIDDGDDFYTNGRSILNGGIRILVKASGVPVDSMTANHPPARESVPKGKEPKEGPMISREVRQRVNAFARESFKVKLLQEIEFDLLVCRLEGWNMESYVCEIKGLIDDIFQKMTDKERSKL